jgi:uncharacterized protein YndB with AHSA1/START domain
MLSTKTLTINEVGDRDLVITRAFDAPRSLVFEALTTPALLKRWLLGPAGWTMPVCELDLKPGGRIRYEWTKGETRMGLTGMFREIVRPSRIVHTESFDEDWTGGETLVTTTLEENEGRTTMSMTVRYASSAARKQALQSGMTEGMSQTYDLLDELLASGEIGA